MSTCYFAADVVGTAQATPVLEYLEESNDAGTATCRGAGPGARDLFCYWRMNWSADNTYPSDDPFFPETLKRTTWLPVDAKVTVPKVRVEWLALDAYWSRLPPTWAPSTQ